MAAQKELIRVHLSVGDLKHDPSALGEAQDVLTDFLALIKYEDPTHHDAMVALVHPSDDTEVGS